MGDLGLEMNKNTKKILFRILFFAGLIIDLLLLFWVLKILGIWNPEFALLSPKGVIAAGQKNVLVTSILLMFTMAVPFYAFAYFVIQRYRADNNSDAEYQPELSGTTFKQVLLWILPAILVFGLSVIIWRSSHALDPFRQINSNLKPTTIQVVALEWKWLFIYPEQDIATVNFVEFPENTPITFNLTADGPVSSFWIPELGGQMYAMAAMTTKLNLMAGQQGEFRGQAAEINGEGYSGMTFVAKSVSRSEFDQWVNSVKSLPNQLNQEEYAKLVQPSKSNPASYYSFVDTTLFDSILNKYMNPNSTHEQERVHHPAH